MRVKAKNKFVYSLADVLGVSSSRLGDSSSGRFLIYLSSVQHDHQIATNFPEVLKEENSHLVYASDHCKNLLNFLCNDHYDDIVLVIESKEQNAPTTTEYNKHMDSFIFSLLNKLNASAPRYKTLLDLYKDKEDKMLDGIKSTTTGVSRFNDTPQNDGEFDDDDHNTNLTKTEGEVVSDGLTPMLRLKEIQEAYRNLIEDWAKEFRVFFIAPSNYEVEEDE